MISDQGRQATFFDSHILYKILCRFNNWSNNPPDSQHLLQFVDDFITNAFSQTELFVECFNLRILPMTMITMNLILFLLSRDLERQSTISRLLLPVKVESLQILRRSHCSFFSLYSLNFVELFGVLLRFLISDNLQLSHPLTSLSNQKGIVLCIQK